MTQGANPRCCGGVSARPECTLASLMSRLIGLRTERLWKAVAPCHLILLPPHPSLAHHRAAPSSARALP
eukprot:6483385-Pyramimonas_sp.AAC.1